MREKLQAAIERAFIDLHYAEAELRSGRPVDKGPYPEIDHIRLAIQELQSAIALWEDLGSAAAPSCSLA